MIGKNEKSQATGADIDAIRRGRESDANDAGNILARIEEFLNTYVAFPKPEQATVCAIWILHTYMFDNAYATPYLYVNSAEPQCGKTRLIETMMVLARNPEQAANLTASSLFRAMEADSAKPSLFVDEVDTIFAGKANEELRSILNSGYKYNGIVRRTLPGKNEDSDVVEFSTFFPKLLAGIDNGQIPPTIADRCIPIILKRKRKDQEVSRFLPRKVEPLAAALKKDIMSWVIDNMEAVDAWEPEEITEISDRSFEISEPLLQIAMQIDSDTATRVKDAIIDTLTGKAEKVLTPTQKALLAAKNYLMPADDMPRDHVYTATLAEIMGVSSKQISEWLKKYEITPQLIQTGGTRARGFYRHQFEDAWERYI